MSDTPDQATAVDMLGVAVQALREVADEKYAGHGVTVATSALSIIENRFTSGWEWQLVPTGKPAPPQEAGPPVRFALVEQMGHRSTVGAVRETTFCGRPMLGVTDLRHGSEHLVAPESLYEITWLTEDEARQRSRPWTAAALPAAAGHGEWTVDETQFEDGEPEDVCNGCAGPMPATVADWWVGAGGKYCSQACGLEDDAKRQADGSADGPHA